MKEKLISFVTIVFMTAPGMASSEITDSFNGALAIGAIVIDGGNNLNPDESNARLDNLDSSADRKTTLLPGILPEVTWDVGEPEGMKFYLTTDPPIDEVGGFALNLGASYGIGRAGILDTALFFTPFEEAWKNPYLTGVDREETDTTKYGVRIGLNRIMGTGLRVQLVYLSDDVDDDNIGALIPELARDGSVYSVNLNYSYYVSKNFEIRPRVSVRNGDYDGEANSYMKYKIDFEARYLAGQWMIVPRVYFSHSDFEETNPIFDKTRDNDSYGISLMTTYMAPFQYENWSLTCLVSMSKGDSNIDFYDTEAMTLGGLLSYHF